MIGRRIMKKHIILFLSLCILSISLLTACSNDAAKEDSQAPTGKQVYVVSTGITNALAQLQWDSSWADKMVLPTNISPLTGLPTMTEEGMGSRPVAIMVNNIPKAMPQYGVAAADIIFEVTVEGGQSRFMALYADYTQVPVVCPIRSCRKYFPELSEGFDAIYVCSGMSSDVKEYINTLGLTKYEGTYNSGKLFGRDQERRSQGYALEHTMYFKGTGLAEALKKAGQRTTIEEDKAGEAFLFGGLAEKIVPTGGACNEVKINFGSMTAKLTYDATTNTYLKQISGKDQIDSVEGTQLAFTNVIVMETKVGKDPNGKDRTIDWTGGDNSIAYYISNGAMQKIHWKKDSIESRLIFYDEEGNELKINRGKTYIAINFIGKTTFN